MTRKSICTFFIIFMILILGLSAVNAADLENETIHVVDTSVDTNSLSFSNEDILTASNTFWVSGNGDDSNDGSQSNPFKTINKAVDSINNDGAVIHLDNSIFYEHNLNIYYETTIIGDNSIIDAQNQGRIISADYGLTLKGITFINGQTSDDGGALYITNHDLKIENCVFKDNNANLGGAIYAENTNINIKSTEFNENQASNTGGSIYIKGLNTLKEAYFDKCKFNNNFAFEEAGALAIYNKIETTIRYSSFNNNRGDYGGAISASRIDLNIRFSNFTENQASEGGAICLDANNNEIDIAGCNFNQNLAFSSGGAIYYSARNNGEVDFYSNNFTLNSANEGGAIYTTYAIINNNYFTENNANQNGGAVYIINGEISNSKFEKNNAYGNGGSVYIESLRGNSLTISENTFNFNNADNGGGVYTAAMAQFSKNKYGENQAKNGGAIFTENDITINDDEYHTNIATENGGAIYIQDGDLTSNYSKFYYNNASNGGAIYTNNCPLKLVDDEFGNNHASINGGALFTDGGNIESSGSTFNLNKADFNGGAIYSVESVLTLKNSNSISHNTALNNGGAVYMTNGEISTSIFSQNTAINGGAIFLFNEYDNSVFITDSQFNLNKALNNGGAVFNNVKLTFKDNYLSDNDAIYYGGVIYNNETLTVKDNTLLSNGNAEDGYYIYNNGEIFGARIVILDNATIYTDKTLFEGYATYLDDNNNEISGGSIDIWINGRYFSDTLIPITNQKAIFNFTPQAGNNILTCEEYTTKYDTRINYDGACVIFEEKYEGPFYVSVNGDDQSKGNVENPLKTITEAIILANSYNTIIYLLDDIDENNIVIIGNTTIIGLNNPKITSNDLLFKITENSNLTLINLTLTNIKSTAIKSNGNLYINNVTLKENDIPIEVYGGNAIIKNSNFISNNASAIHILNSLNVNITNTKFISNNASDDGGAIYHEKGYLFVDNSEFSQNNALCGGAVYIKDNAILTNNIFNLNTAKSLGGSIYNLGYLKLSNNTVGNSQAAIGSKIYNGGVIDTVYLTFLNNQTITSITEPITIYCKVTDDMDNYITAGTLKVTDNNIEIKTLNVIDGELIFESEIPFAGTNIISGIYESGNSNPQIVKTGIIISSAEKYNGPFYVSPTGSDDGKGTRDDPFKTIQKAIELTKSTFNSKEIILLEGNYYENTIRINFTGLFIHGEENNVVIDGNGKNSIFIIDLFGDETKISNITIINTYSGAIKDNGESNTLILDNITIINNTHGSAVKGSSYGGVEVNNSKFINNMGNYSGSAISGDYIYIYNSEFINNTVDYTLFGYGGAIYAVGGIISDSVFKNNSAAFGGDIYIFSQGGNGYAGYIEITNSRFSDSKAVYGGAIYNIGHLNLVNNTITNPTANYGKYIFNAGILENYVLTFLGNSTVYVGSNTNGLLTFINNEILINSPIYLPANSNVVLSCKITDDNGNPIHGKKINFLIDGVELTTVNVNEGYANVSYVPKEGKSIVSGEYLVIDDWLSMGYPEIYNGEIISFSNSYAGPFYVSKDGNDNSNGDETHPVKTIQKAIDLASINGGTVYVGEGIYHESNLQIPNNVKIIGLGNAIIDAEGKDRIFNVYEKINGIPFEIANITLVNGNATSGKIVPSYVTYSHPFVDIDEGAGGAINYADFGSLKGSVSIENVKFINNTAETGGAIFAGSVNIDGKSSFTGNAAIAGDNVVALEKITGNPINDAIILDYIIAKDYQNQIYNYMNGTGPVRFKDNLYYYYTDESFNGSYIGYGTDLYIDNMVEGYITPVLNFYYNLYDGSNVADYLKILIMQNLGKNSSNVQKAVYVFTDEDYKNSNNTLVKNAIKSYDDGLRYPSSGSIMLNNGTEFKYEFKGFRTPLSYYSVGKNGFDYYQENLLLFGNLTITGFNETVKKETLNKTVVVGDNVDFRIIVFNTGNQTLEGVFVVDTYDILLEYLSWKSEVGNWTYNVSLNRWILNNPLLSGDNASLILTFKTLGTGILRNNVTSGFDNITFANSTNVTNVINPNLAVSKITLNESVILYNQTSFKIIVTNTGDVNLTNVFVLETSYDDLIYDSFKSIEGNWIHTFNGLKHAFTLDELKVGANASFIVIFNTTSAGNKTNIIIVGSNETSNKTTNNTTFVYNPNLTVSKITLNKTVYLGNLVEFEIIVRNTGNVDLDNVFIIEEYFDEGISYYNYSPIKGTWNHILNNDNKHQFNLFNKLKVNDYASFRVIFKTAEIGNKTNVVVAGYNNTNITNSTNTTEIVNITNKTEIKNKTPDNPKINKTPKNNIHPKKDVKIKTPTTENKVPNVSTASKVVSLKTGNSIFLLLLAIFVGSQIRRKKINPFFF